MSAGRICVREVDTADPDETVLVAARRMQARNVGTLVVVDAGGKPTGLVTDRDLTVRVLAAPRDAGTTMVREVMTECPRTIDERAPIEEALRLMRAGKFRRLPIVDDAGRLVGLLSLDDVLVLLTEEFRDIGRLLEEESPRSLARD